MECWCSTTGGQEKNKFFSSWRRRRRRKAMGLKHSSNFRGKIRDMSKSHGIDLLKITFWNPNLIYFGLIALLSSNTKTWSKTRGINMKFSTFQSLYLFLLVEIILGNCWPDESNSSASTYKVLPRARPRISRMRRERKQCSKQEWWSSTFTCLQRS